MPEPSRLTVARQLEPLGLRKTLITVRNADRYDVSRIRSVGDTVELTRMGSFSTDRAPRIGRVGVADPHFALPWKNSMPFYGKWFDDIGETDVGYHLRRSLASVSRQRMLEQVRRDEQYAVIGSFYSVFQTIMDIKHRVPLVLIDDTFLTLESFPVILPRIADADLEQTLLDVLRRMLRPEVATPSPREAGAGDTGIEVDEI